MNRLSLRNNLITFFFIHLLLSPMMAHSQDIGEKVKENEPSRTIEVYEGAKPIERSPPRYPRIMAQDSRDGWVDFNFMISTSGETYEIESTDHSYGGVEFIEDAKKAVSKYRYEPANINGEPVDSSGSIRIRFEMGKRTVLGVSRKFNFRYREFHQALSEKNQTKTKEKLDRLASSGALSLYDDAYLNFAHYLYEKEFGTPQAQLIYLEKAVNDWGQKRYFKNDIYTSLLANLFVLQTTQNHFVEALRTHRNLANQDDTFDLLTNFEGAVRKIEDIRKDDTAYKVEGVLRNTNNWTISLYKPSFSLENITGKIDELKLRCSKKYVFFKHEEGNAYQIPKSYGYCYLSVIGAPESTFNLVQFGNI